MKRVVVALFVLAVVPAAADSLPSGTTFLSDGLKMRQADEMANPGMLWVENGARLWMTKDGAAGKSCADCHGEPEGMKGVATRYPAVDGKSGELLNLAGRINKCRTENQKTDAFPYEADPLLSLTAFVKRQSLGMPMHVDVSGPAAATYEKGKAFFNTRRGQLNLSCAQCHEESAGRRLRGDTISYGLGNGYPTYRLEWQTLGSLQRRFRSCLSALRARSYGDGSPEFLALELFLAKRADGVPIETPAIRP